MRNLLTFVAVALVTALLVALVAPPLVDWSGRRDLVARAIAGRAGAPVTIGGPVELRLLPTPYLEAADVTIGPRAAPWLQAPAMRLEFGFASLFGGRIELDDVAFDHPTLRLGPSFAPPSDGPFAFGHVRLAHAELSFARAGAAPVALHDLSLDAAAPTPRGPWRGGGEFASGDARAHFEIAAGEIVGAAATLKAELDAGATRVDLDGRLTFGAAPGYQGQATIVGQAPAPDGGAWPWRVGGEVVALGDAATMAAAEVRLGDEARSVEATGRLAVQFGPEPSLDADLVGKTLNLDALLRRDKEGFAPPSRAFAALATLAARMLSRDAPLASFSLKLSADNVYLGARALERPSVTLSGAPNGRMALAARSGLPGRGRVSLQGALELGAAPILRGRGEASVGDFAPLAAWIAEDDASFAARLAGLGSALPQGEIAAAGDVEISPQGFSARGLTLDIGDTRLDGGAVYRRPAEDRRGRLYLDLASRALDIAAAPNVEAGLAWLGDTDLDLALNADTLRVARVGLASVQGGSLRVRATKDGPKFALQQLSLADLGGATIEAEGEESPSGRWARVRLDAGRLGDFAALLARAAPSPLTRWLQSRADDLGAARATFEARRDGPPLPGAFNLDFVKADGEIAGARFGLTLSRAPAPVDAIAADAHVDAPDAGALLRRLGAKLAAGPPGRAEASLSATGLWERGFDAKARLALAGAQIEWSGALRPEGDGPWAEGSATLKSADLFPALAALGIAAAGTGATAPADLGAEVEAADPRVRASRLAGALAGAHVAGELTWTPPRALSLDDLVAAQTPQAAQAPPAITGALDFDHASLAGLTALLLGRPAPPRPGALWPELKFGAALLSPPDADVALKVAAFDLGGSAARALSARLKLQRGALALDEFVMSIGGGEASGRLDLRRDAAQATASGALAWQGLTLEHGGVHAQSDGALDFAGAGASAAALAGSLAGAGQIKLAEASVARLDPEALARVYARLEQAAGPPPDEKRLEELLGAELDRAPLTLAGASGALALIGGQLRFGPLAQPSREGRTQVSGSLDLADLSLKLDATLTGAKTGPFWSGPAPSVDVAIANAAGAPTRRIEAAVFDAGLAAEALARESDRIANFEADLRERAMFNRRYKAERFLARREAEIRAFEDEQERRRLMERYLSPYSERAAPAETAPADAAASERSPARTP